MMMMLMMTMVMIMVMIRVLVSECITIDQWEMCVTVCETVSVAVCDYLEGRRDDEDDADADAVDDGWCDIISDLGRGSWRWPKALRCESSQSIIACSRYTCNARMWVGKYEGVWERVWERGWVRGWVGEREDEWEGVRRFEKMNDMVFRRGCKRVCRRGGSDGSCPNEPDLALPVQAVPWKPFVPLQVHWYSTLIWRVRSVFIEC